MNNDNYKHSVWALLGLVIVLVAGFFLWKERTAYSVGMENLEEQGVMCTMDAMQCPDGSWVGRSGPNCQFVCPVGTSTQSSETSVLLEARYGEVSSSNH